MLDTGTCAHHLHVAGDNAARISQVVTMAQYAVAHKGNDLHVGVGMRRENRRSARFRRHSRSAAPPSRSVHAQGRNDAWLRANRTAHQQAIERADVRSHFAPMVSSFKLASIILLKNRKLRNIWFPKMALGRLGGQARLTQPLYFPSNTRAGGSISLLKASAVFAKPRCASHR
jgi:hypothetical protein